MLALWVAAGILGLVLLYVVLTFNGLVRLRVRAENAWSQIDVQLRRRYDLIPNLIEAVRGYAAHEREVFEEVTRARVAAVEATGVEGQARAENEVTRSLNRLLAVAEQYPSLRASENFLALQEELTGTESKIAFARQFYNDQVMALNNKVHQFPWNLIAGAGGFRPAEFFIIDEPAQREAPKVAF